MSVDRDYDCRVIKEIYLQNARIASFSSLLFTVVSMLLLLLLLFFSVALGKVLSYWINRFNMYINEFFLLFTFLVELLLFCYSQNCSFHWDRFEPVNINLRWFCETAFVHSFHLVRDYLCALHSSVSPLASSLSWCSSRYVYFLRYFVICCGRFASSWHRLIVKTARGLFIMKIHICKRKT